MWLSKEIPFTLTGFFSLSGHDYHKQKAAIMNILSDIHYDKRETAELRIQQSGTDIISWLEDKGKPLLSLLGYWSVICRCLCG